MESVPRFPRSAQIDERFEGRAHCVGIGGPVELVLPEIADAAYQGQNFAVSHRK